MQLLRERQTGDVARSHVSVVGSQQCCPASGGTDKHGQGSLCQRRNRHRPSLQSLARTELMEGTQFQLWQQAVAPGAGLSPMKPPIRVTGPKPSPAAIWKVTLCILMSEKSEAELL